MDDYSHYLSKLERQLCCRHSLSLFLSAISGTLVFPENFSGCQFIFSLPFSALPVLLTKHYSRTDFICSALADVNQVVRIFQPDCVAKHLIQVVKQDLQYPVAAAVTEMLPCGVCWPESSNFDSFELQKCTFLHLISYG